MINLNEHLILSEEVEALVKTVENAPLYFTEAKLEDHPEFPNHSRYLRVFGIDTKSFNEFAVIFYAQVGKHKKTGEEWTLPLNCPEFVIYRETWSYLRDPKTNEILMAENSETGTQERVRVPSFKYMVHLSKNGVSITNLLNGYLPAFIVAAGEKLNEKTELFRK